MSEYMYAVRGDALWSLFDAVTVAIAGLIRSTKSVAEPSTARDVLVVPMVFNTACSSYLLKLLAAIRQNSASQLELLTVPPAAAFATSVTRNLQLCHRIFRQVAQYGQKKKNLLRLIRSKNGALKEGQSGLLHLHAHAVSRASLIGRLLTPPKLPCSPCRGTYRKYFIHRRFWAMPSPCSLSSLELLHRSTVSATCWPHVGH